MLFGVELTDNLCGTTGSSCSGDCVDLLGVKSHVTALSADHIMLGWMWGSSNNSLTIAILEPSSWLTSTWCSIIGLVGVVIRGVWSQLWCYWWDHGHGPWYFVCGPCFWFGSSSTDQSGQWPQYEHPACVIGELDFPSHATKLGPQKKNDRIYHSPGVL